jgi:transcriptional/translational regulatory protein YebC/TACO1
MKIEAPEEHRQIGAKKKVMQKIARQIRSAARDGRARSN